MAAAAASGTARGAGERRRLGRRARPLHGAARPLGANVVVADIDFALAGEVAASIRGAGGGALAHRCDVAMEDQVVALIDRAAREYSALDLVFILAGPWLPGRSARALVLHCQRQPAGHHARDAAGRRIPEASRWRHRQRGG